MNIYLSLLVCLVGLVMFVMNTPPPARWARVGEIMCFAGLLAFLLQFGKIVDLLGGSR